MFNPCKYSTALKCKVCTTPFHRECKKFVIAHAKDISRELGVFVYSSKVKITDKVIWSRDENKAKSVALKFAIKRNTRIKKYTLSQVISLALSGDTIEDGVVYIEHKTKLSGDSDKLKGVLTSFVDALLLRGSLVSIFVSPTTSFNLEYDKV